MENEKAVTPIVGTIMLVALTNPKKDHVVVTGLFSDGSSAIIAESTL